MAESSSVNVILEFLKTNKFDEAEAALCNEIGNREETVLEIYLKKFSSSNGLGDVKSNVKEYSISSQSNDKNQVIVKMGVEKDFPADRKHSSQSWNASIKMVFPSSKGNASTSYDTSNETKAFGGLDFPVISKK
ncbi:hypothetical protein Tco_0488585 [Tanacetum coccineum]